MLDAIDLQILEKLADNGRISLTELSVNSELSRVAIANRIEKLLQNDLLRVSALLNLDRLNYQTLIVELQIDNGKKSEFKKLISDCPKVVQAFEITGQFNHLLVCSSKSSNSLRRFVDDVLKRYAKECKVTLSSNPIASGFVHIKSHIECEQCRRLKIE
ncbi:MAG: Lrp/AsnC family transcriptional regulator [DPANN group archaeon]|nr:Lrp/AsnC family transcriptional regulator [DPANN group archaeon]